MVALLGLFDLLEIDTQFFRIREGRSVEALQHRVGFDAVKIGACHIHQFECLNLAGALYVRAAAQILELTTTVKGDRLSLGNFGKAFELVGLSLQDLFRLVAGSLDDLEGVVLVNDFLHFGFDVLEIVRRDTVFQVEVVVESLVG